MKGVEECFNLFWYVKDMRKKKQKEKNDKLATPLLFVAIVLLHSEFMQLYHVLSWLCYRVPGSDSVHIVRHFHKYIFVNNLLKGRLSIYHFRTPG